MSLYALSHWGADLGHSHRPAGSTRARSAPRRTGCALRRRRCAACRPCARCSTSCGSASARSARTTLGSVFSRPCRSRSSACAASALAESRQARSIGSLAAPGPSAVRRSAPLADARRLGAYVMLSRRAPCAGRVALPRPRLLAPRPRLHRCAEPHGEEAGRSGVWLGAVSCRDGQDFAQGSRRPGKTGATAPARQRQVLERQPQRRVVSDGVDGLLVEADLEVQVRLERPGDRHGGHDVATFSLSTRSQSADRPANQNQPAVSR